jgi:uncharacterized protein (TIGR02246 family)
MRKKKTRRLILLGVFSLALSLSLQVEGQTSGCGNVDEKGIQAVLNEFNNAWTARSAARYAAVFADDADWENAFGGRRKGRAEIEKFITELAGTFTNATEKVTDTRIWCMSPKMALIDIYQTVDGQQLPSGTIVPTRHIRMTQVYEKRGDKWQIKVHRVTDLREMRSNRINKETGKAPK